MPRHRQPKRLKDVCIGSVVRHVDTYWLPEGSEARDRLDAFLANAHHRYLISPFYHLDDATVEAVLRALYRLNRLSRYHLLLFVQSPVRALDLSFVKKKNLVSQPFAYYVGRNCFVSL